MTLVTNVYSQTPIPEDVMIIDKIQLSDLKIKLHSYKSYAEVCNERVGILEGTAEHSRQIIQSKSEEIEEVKAEKRGIIMPILIFIGGGLAGAFTHSRR